MAFITAGEAIVSSRETLVAVGSKDKCCTKSLTRSVVRGTQDDIEGAIEDDGEFCHFAVGIIVTVIST